MRTTRDPRGAAGSTGRFFLDHSTTGAARLVHDSAARFDTLSIQLAKQLFRLTGIAREDRAKRDEWVRWGFRLYGAPALIILSVEASLPERLAFFDCGALAQTICLTALKFGLGTCISGQGVAFPEIVQKFTGLRPSQRLIISIVTGYPDWKHPANKLESRREAIDNVVRWCG